MVTVAFNILVSLAATCCLWLCCRAIVQALNVENEQVRRFFRL